MKKAKEALAARRSSLTGLKGIKLDAVKSAVTGKIDGFKSGKADKQEAYAKLAEYHKLVQPAIVYFVSSSGNVQKATLTKVSNSGAAKKLGVGKGYVLKVEWKTQPEAEVGFSKTFGDPRHVHLTEGEAAQELVETLKKMQEKKELKEKKELEKKNKASSKSKLSKERSKGPDQTDEEGGSASSHSDADTDISCEPGETVIASNCGATEVLECKSDGKSDTEKNTVDEEKEEGEDAGGEENAKKPISYISMKTSHSIKTEIIGSESFMEDPERRLNPVIGIGATSFMADPDGVLAQSNSASEPSEAPGSESEKPEKSSEPPGSESEKPEPDAKDQNQPEEKDPEEKPAKAEEEKEQKPVAEKEQEHEQKKEEPDSKLENDTREDVKAAAHAIVEEIIKKVSAESLRQQAANPTVG